MNTIQNEAACLHGSEYPFRPSLADQERWKKENIVVVFGASDDLIEFRGAIYDEAWVSDNEPVFFTRAGFPLNRCVCDDSPYFAEMLGKDMSSITPIWSGSEVDADWAYDTEIPHETFDIMEDGRIYCRALVFSIEEVAG